MNRETPTIGLVWSWEYFFSSQQQDFSRYKSVLCWDLIHKNPTPLPAKFYAECHEIPRLKTLHGHANYDIISV